MAGDYGGVPTRYGALFGAPEWAAKTVHALCVSGLLQCRRSNASGVEIGRCPLKVMCDELGAIQPTEDEIETWLYGGYDDRKVRESLGH